MSGHAESILVAATASAGVTALVTSNASVPYIGVPLVVPVMCLLAASIAMGLSEPVKPRGKMFFLLASTVLLGTLSVNVWPHAPMFGWTEKVPPVALGPATSFILQWLLLPAIEAGKRAINGYKAGKSQEPEA